MSDCEQLNYELLDGDDSEEYDLDQEKEEELLQDDDDDDYQTVDESKSLDLNDPDDKFSPSPAKGQFKSSDKEPEEDVLDLGLETEDFQDIEVENRNRREDKFATERNHQLSSTMNTNNTLEAQSKRVQHSKRKLNYKTNPIRNPDTTWRKPVNRPPFRAPPKIHNDRRSRTVLINPKYGGVVHITNSNNSQQGWEHESHPQHFVKPVEPWVTRITPLAQIHPTQPIPNLNSNPPFYEPPPRLMEQPIPYPPPIYQQNQWEHRSISVNSHESQVPRPFFASNQPPPLLPNPNDYSNPGPSIRPLMVNIDLMSMNQDYASNSNNFSNNQRFNPQNYQGRSYNSGPKSQKEYLNNNSVHKKHFVRDRVNNNLNTNYKFYDNHGYTNRNSGGNFQKKNYPAKYVNNDRPDQNTNNRQVDISNYSEEKFQKEAAQPHVQTMEEPIIVEKVETKTTFESAEEKELREYNLKIEEQKRKREEILRMKEERRRAALEKNQLEETSEKKPKLEQLPQKFIPQPPSQIHEDVHDFTLRVANNLVKRQPPQFSSALKRVKIHDVLPVQSDFMANRVVSVKHDARVSNTVAMGQNIAQPGTYIPQSGKPQTCSTFFSERKILSKDNTFLSTKLVVVSNLSTATSEDKLSKMTQGVGTIENLQMDKQTRQATILFKSVASAHAFFKKYQRYMLDLSMIEVKLVPML